VLYLSWSIVTDLLLLIARRKYTRSTTALTALDPTSAEIDKVGSVLLRLKPQASDVS
jgi:hypothetical protein